MTDTHPLNGTSGSVARVIREAIQEKKISGRALADQLGMKQSAFSRRMTGEVAFTIDELAAVAAVLEVPVADLIRNVPAPAPASAA